MRRDCTRTQPDCRDLVWPVDSYGLLSGPSGVNEAVAEFVDDAAIVAKYGVSVALMEPAQCLLMADCVEKLGNLFICVKTQQRRCAKSLMVSMLFHPIGHHR